MPENEWFLVDYKSVMDSDGFMTDYAWYTNGETNVFVFGDMDLYRPEDGYWDWEEENDDAAETWFSSYGEE